MKASDIILKKRDGKRITSDELAFLVSGYLDRSIPEYQFSAFLMAVYFQGLTFEETIDLTRIMIDSGRQLDLSTITKPVVDKHSTGGVGDKTTMVLGPLLASAGIALPKLSGRGLGFTGGTLDKLEAFPGINLKMSSQQFIRQVEKVGIAIMGQTPDLVPADREIYALRDVTGTVDQLSLIASSIMSKKIAGGSHFIFLDVKAGDGAFMKTPDKAFELAEWLVKIGREFDRETVALVTDMSQPLGNAIGNANEIQEAIKTLQGKGPDDLNQLCFSLGSEILHLAQKIEIEQAKELLADLIDSGKALEKFEEMVNSQGGSFSSFKQMETDQSNQFKEKLKAPRSGFIQEISASRLGEASMILGAGREKKEDPIDLNAGILLEKKVGEKIEAGQVLLTLFTNDESKLEPAKRLVEESIGISDSQVQPPKLILGKVTQSGINRY